MRLRAGFIPLVDAAVLVAAADRGFAADEGLDLELVREVSWSNVRDKLNLGHFEAAHVLAPMAIAETLGLDYPRVPLTAALVLSHNGNSIVLSNDMHAQLESRAAGDLDDPLVSGAALRRFLAEGAGRGDERPFFGMTFPFSNHNYLLRYWMAASGVDPDEDVRLAVLPPSYMVDGLCSGKLHGFCAGAPWPALAVEAGVGRILHFGSDIVARCPEKVLAMRASWVEANPQPANALTRALIRASAWSSMPENRVELAHLLAGSGRLNVPVDVILRALEGRLRVDASGRIREDAGYLMIGSPGSRPDPGQALWMYAQMARWGQVQLSDEDEQAVRDCFSPRLYDRALASMATRPDTDDGIGAFAGPAFDPGDLPGYLAEVTAQSAVMHNK